MLKYGNKYKTYNMKFGWLGIKLGMILGIELWIETHIQLDLWNKKKLVLRFNNLMHEIAKLQKSTMYPSLIQVLFPSANSEIFLDICMNIIST